MLYHVPSGSKSPGFGFATGCAFRKALRSATMLHVPSAATRRMAFVVRANLCEQPDPAVIAYIVLPINATSATPLTRLPSDGLVRLGGRLSTRVVRLPCASILELRDVNPPVYEPASGPWSHMPAV